MAADADDATELATEALDPAAAEAAVPPGVRRKALWALILSALAFGSTYVPSQRALDHLSAIGAVSIRFMVASALMFPALARFGVRGSGRMFWAGPIVAGVVNSVGFLTMSAALQRTSASNAAFLGSLSVVIIPLAAALIARAWPAPPVLAGVALAVLGSFLLAGASLRVRSGDVLAVCDAMVASMHITSIAYFAPRLPSTWFNAGQTVVSMLVMVPLAVAFGFGDPTTGSVLLAVYCGVSQAVAITLQVYAQRHLSATTSVLVLLLVPVAGSAMGILIADDPLTGTGVLGALLIIAAVLTVEVLPSWRARRSAAAVPVLS